MKTKIAPKLPVVYSRQLKKRKWMWPKEITRKRKKKMI